MPDDRLNEALTALDRLAAADATAQPEAKTNAETKLTALAKAMVDSVSGAPDERTKATALEGAKAAATRLAGREHFSLDALVRFVAQQNPYTAGKMEDMDFHLFSPPEGVTPRHDSQIEVEVDGNYPGEWNFKGVPQKISKVLRIKYRCKARKKHAYHTPTADDNVDPFYWMTAFLLIGYEDGL